jgi:hypothetical protein
MRAKPSNQARVTDREGCLLEFTPSGTNLRDAQKRWNPHLPAEMPCDASEVLCGAARSVPAKGRGIGRRYGSPDLRKHSV